MLICILYYLFLCGTLIFSITDKCFTTDVLMVTMGTQDKLAVSVCHVIVILRARYRLPVTFRASVGVFQELLETNVMDVNPVIPWRMEDVSVCVQK